jgi:two-component system, OmpR family, heavy metal sensor histidine kinase CusS
LFRLKIALLSVLLSGLVFMGLGLYALSIIEKVGLARIDREILALGESPLAVKPPRDYWNHFGASLRFIYGQGRSEDLIVRVRDAASVILFQSPHWPKEITEQTFPAFNRLMDTHPPASRERGMSGPPPEAYAACEGKPAGSQAEFVDHRGELLQGRCEEDQGRMVLRPEANRRKEPVSPGEEGTVSPPPRRPDPVEGIMPKIKKKPFFATVSTSSGLWRTGIMGTDRFTLMIGMNLAGFNEEVALYRRAFLGIVPIALLLLASGGWLIARRALRPVSLITGTAERITVRDLHQRIPEVDTDRELTRLVEVINGMLSRLEKSFSQAIRFTADAAHELQTPLTILQGELDGAVQTAPIGSEEQQRYSGLLEEVQRLKAIVQKLLILARADAGRLDLRLERLDLSTMVETAAEDIGAMAPHLKVVKEIMPGILIKGDPDFLGQIIMNLTSNAVKYNHDPGTVFFRLSVRNETAFLTLSNTGVQIPAEAREKIFDRFFRVDPSRSKTIPGSGLGLSLAREIAQAHGGDLRLDPDVGSMISFTLSFPAFRS